MFSIKKIDLSIFNNAGKIVDVGCLFKDCSSLKEIDLKPFKSSDVKNMNNMFSGCSQLETIKFPSSFNTMNVIDMSNMFNECSLLINLDLSSFSFSELKNLSKMFNSCSSLKKLLFQCLMRN